MNRHVAQGKPLAYQAPDPTEIRSNITSSISEPLQLDGPLLPPLHTLLTSAALTPARDIPTRQHESVKTCVVL